MDKQVSNGKLFFQPSKSEQIEEIIDDNGEYLPLILMLKCLFAIVCILIILKYCFRTIIFNVYILYSGIFYFYFSYWERIIKF